MDQTIIRPLVLKNVEPKVSFGFAAIVEADGKNMEILVEPNWNSMGASSFKPRLIGDIDGDGMAEIIGRSYYYEGSSEVIVRWKSDKLELTTLEFSGC
jgi:hypothetical protein